jgi:putative aldouronate transport system permease protein
MSASISDPYIVSGGGLWLWPVGINFSGIRKLLEYKDIWLGYRNTIFYTFLGTAINLIVTLPCAYACSRKDFIASSPFMKFILVTMFFSGGMIPTYMLVSNLKIINSVWALVLPNAATVFNIIVARSFYAATVPHELEEAAEIDGMNEFGIYLKIIMPLSVPILVVMAIYYGVDHWNSYFNAMIYITERNKFPLQLILREILIVNSMENTISQINDPNLFEERMLTALLIKYGAMIISTFPLVMLYLFAQRFFIKGVMIGSIKG